MLRWLERWAFNRVQKRIGTWGDKTFPKATPESIYRHLCREIKELGEDYALVEAEHADCILLLTHIAHKKKFSMYDAFTAKFEINKRRKWGKPDAEGVVEHID